MERFYGTKPYKVAVVHGGPGGLGDVAGLARGISEKYGVIEPIQSKYSIEELIEELRSQIEQYCTLPITLIGHSWGAWLAGLVSERYPHLINKLVLIGCGPLTIEYVQEIGIRRQRNMTRAERLEFAELISALDHEDSGDKDSQLARLGTIAKKADSFRELKLETEAADLLPSDGEMYSKIWTEAAKLRESGELLSLFKNITSPIILIQGEADSHPYKGIVEPLSESNMDLQIHILEKCGHTPWKEKYAQKLFYQIIFDCLA